MVASKAQIKANNKWSKNNYDRVTTVIPKGRKDDWRAEANRRGKSLNAFVIDSVEKEIQEWEKDIP